MREEISSNLPLGYTLELVGDPCVIVLRRDGEVVVARFTHNVDPEEIRRAAEEVHGPGPMLSSILMYKVGGLVHRRTLIDK
jgi:hypothetical protein